MHRPRSIRTAVLTAVAALGLLGGLPRTALAQDVDIQLQDFGVGGAHRPGEFVAIRLAITPTPGAALDTATPAWVQWDVPNADGDIAEYGRRIALTVGQTTQVWLYAPIAPDTLMGVVWPVRVYEFEDGERGREIGGARIAPTGTAVELSAGMVGIVGDGTMGLGQLKFRATGTGEVVQTAHEDTYAVSGIRPAGICDRWEGLKCFDAIVWAGALPQDLGLAPSEALREWVRRGGHLVISLPEDTNPWGLGERGTTDLEDLLPTQTPRKDEDVPLSKLMPLVSKSAGLEQGYEFPLSIRVFKDLAGTLDRLDNGYEPLMALADGRVVVVQRLFGHGRITIVGIDLANSRLVGSKPLSNGMQSVLPQADVFWARILGHRADTPTSGELQRIQDEDRLARGVPTEVPVGDGRAFRQHINMSAKAGVGLLLALVLFLAYWVVAGPGGYAVLRHLGHVQHAWVSFAAAAAIFTAIAWGGVNLLRKNEISVRHVTFLDHIWRPPDTTDREANDPQLQRTVSWMSVYLPGYGDTPIGIESLDANGMVRPQRDLLVSWTPPHDVPQKFPNADRYTVDVQSDPDDFAMPTRSTATQLYANWMGGLDPEWGGLLRVDPEDPIRVELDAAGNEVLRGAIFNDLPTALDDVSVIWIWNRRIRARTYDRNEGVEQAWVPTGKTGQMLNVGRMVRQARIEAGARFRLPSAADGGSLTTNIHERYVTEYEGRSTLAQAGGTLANRDRQQFIEMLCLYGQLTPPKYLKAPEGQSLETMVARRLLGRELDLSPWFGRPCVIVIGYLNESECPIPLLVDGGPVASEGQTVLRWIHPLEILETISFRDDGSS